MLFVISSVSEIFKQNMHELVEEVEVAADDFLVVGWGSTSEAAAQDHDKNLQAEMQRQRNQIQCWLKQWCGAGAYPRQLCPAKDEIYCRCNRLGHFTSQLQCLSNAVAMNSASAEQWLMDHLDQYEDLK